jgi:hypothetical protein
LIGTGAGLLFKGSGFYITDYRSDSYKNAAKNDSGGTPKTESESKPAASAPAGGAGASSGTAAPAAGGKSESAPAPAKVESPPASKRKPAK